MKAFAFVGHERLRQLPELPTLLEVGAADVFNRLWHALFAPAATPASTIDRLNGALRTALSSPALRKVYADGGVEVFPDAQIEPKGAAAFVRGELERWQRIVRQIDLTR